MATSRGTTWAHRNTGLIMCPRATGLGLAAMPDEPGVAPLPDSRELGPSESLRELVRMLERAHLRVRNSQELMEAARDELDPDFSEAIGAELADAVRALREAGACAPARGSARAFDPEVAS